MARVDVLMTAFNAEATIVASAGSILNQTFADLRLIVIDDGSTDRTAELLYAMAKADSRVKVVRQENQGIVAAANHGLSLCDAPLIARMDADDLSFPDRLKHQVRYIDAHPGCVAVSCLAWHVDRDGRRLGTMAGRLVRSDPHAIPSHEPYIMHPFVLVRHDAYRRVGGYRYVDYAEDTDLYWRLEEIGQLAVLNEFLGEYRVHAESISSRALVNGRISALNSQLAAISARRRRAHLADVRVGGDDLAVGKEAASLEGILASIRPRLSDDEFRYVKVAMLAKLLELSSYRPYRLDMADCRMIYATLSDASSWQGLDQSNRGEVERYWAVACARLARQGFLRRAAALYHPRIRGRMVRAMATQLVARLLPDRARRWYRTTRSNRLVLSNS